MSAIYVLIIVVANIITAMFPPIMISNLIIPCGSFLVGITFFMRDFIQLKVGKVNVYKLIVLSAGISGLVSICMGDVWIVALASVISFFVSEALDTELFTRLKLSLKKRIMISGLVGGTLDSAIFVVIALSPIGTNILPWESVPYAILGQTLVKCVMQFLALPVINKLK